MRRIWNYVREIEIEVGISYFNTNFIKHLHDFFLLVAFRVSQSNYRCGQIDTITGGIEEILR